MRQEFPLANVKLKKKNNIFKATVLPRLHLLPVSSERPFKRGASPAGMQGKEGRWWSNTQKWWLGSPCAGPHCQELQAQAASLKKLTQIHKTPQYECYARKLWNESAPGTMVWGHGQTQPWRLRSRVTWAIPKSCKTTQAWMDTSQPQRKANHRG